jgi:hypothetical protein
MINPVCCLIFWLLDRSWYINYLSVWASHWLTGISMQVICPTDCLTHKLSGCLADYQIWDTIFLVVWVLIIWQAQTHRLSDCLIVWLSDAVLTHKLSKCLNIWHDLEHFFSDCLTLWSTKALDVWLSVSLTTTDVLFVWLSDSERHWGTRFLAVWASDNNWCAICLIIWLWEALRH